MSLRNSGLLTNEQHVHKKGMHLVLVTNARKEGVAEDPVHDVKEWVQNPRLLVIGKLLLNIVLLKLVLAGGLGVGMRADANGCLSPSS